MNFKSVIRKIAGIWRRPSVEKDKYVLYRIQETKAGMRGEFQIDGLIACHTLEEPWRDNQSRISCIPPGNYICKKHNGTHFKDVWEITGVPGRQAILIHSGNTLDDTEGCVLVGLNITAQWVGRSRDALQMLRNRLPDTFPLKVSSLPTKYGV